jgi:hypothetical protein
VKHYDSASEQYRRDVMSLVSLEVLIAETVEDGLEEDLDGTS